MPSTKPGQVLFGFDCMTSLLAFRLRLSDEWLSSTPSRCTRASAWRTHKTILFIGQVSLLLIAKPSQEQTDSL